MSCVCMLQRGNSFDICVLGNVCCVVAIVEVCCLFV